MLFMSDDLPVSFAPVMIVARLWKFSVRARSVSDDSKTSLFIEKGNMGFLS
jgi:hypothetical protein